MNPIKKHLLVIPSIDIHNRKTVRVVQGIPELDCKEYGDDPVEMAMIWRAENAKMLHVVDFNGAFDHTKENYDIIKELCSSVIIPIEFAGGIRSVEDAEEVFDLGVYRIAINTMALENRAEFIKLFEKFGPTKIVLSIDILDGKLVTRGRKRKSDLNYNYYVSEMAELGIDRCIVTDVSRNGVMQGPNIALSKEIAEHSKIKVTHSGGLRNKDELLDLQQLIPIGVDSVIIGRAFTKTDSPAKNFGALLNQVYLTRGNNGKEKVAHSSFWVNFFNSPTEETDLKNSLKTIPLFNDLTKGDLTSLIKIIHNRTFVTGELIFHQGDPGIGLYIIRDGEVEIERENAHKVKKVLATFSKGDFFGELALVDGEKRSASAIAKSACKVSVIFKPDLDEFIEKYPRKGIKILTGISSIIALRLRKLNEDYFDLQYNVPEEKGK